MRRGCGAVELGGSHGGSSAGQGRARHGCGARTGQEPLHPSGRGGREHHRRRPARADRHRRVPARVRRGHGRHGRPGRSHRPADPGDEGRRALPRAARRRGGQGRRRVRPPRHRVRQRRHPADQAAAHGAGLRRRDGRRLRRRHERRRHHAAVPRRGRLDHPHRLDRRHDARHAQQPSARPGRRRLRPRQDVHRPVHRGARAAARAADHPGQRGAPDQLQHQPAAQRRAVQGLPARPRAPDAPTT